MFDWAATVRPTASVIPLHNAELKAVDEGIAAHDELAAKLADVPTPDGATPRQLRTRGFLDEQPRTQAA